MGTLSDIVSNIMHSNKASVDRGQQNLDSTSSSMNKNALSYGGSAPQRAQAPQAANANSPSAAFANSLKNVNSGFGNGAALKIGPGGASSPDTSGFGGAGGSGAASDMQMGEASFGDADFQEPGGEAHWTLREEDNFILAKNQRTGQMMKLATQPLSKSEQQQANAPHGAGGLGANDPNRQHSEMNDMDLMGALSGSGMSPGYGLSQSGNSMNVTGSLKQFSNDATQYTKQGSGGSNPTSQQYADGDLTADPDPQAQYPIQQPADAPGGASVQADADQEDKTWEPVLPDPNDPAEIYREGRRGVIDPTSQLTPEGRRIIPADLPLDPNGDPRAVKEWSKFITPVSSEELVKRRTNNSLYADPKSKDNYFAPSSSGDPYIQSQDRHGQSPIVEVHIHNGSHGEDKAVNLDHDKKFNPKEAHGSYADMDLGSTKAEPNKNIAGYMMNKRMRSLESSIRSGMDEKLSKRKGKN